MSFSEILATHLEEYWTHHFHLRLTNELWNFSNIKFMNCEKFTLVKCKVRYILLQYSWQHTLINAEYLKGSAFNAEVLLGVVNHGLMISFITLTCTDIQQFNKQYDHNYFQVDVPDSIGVSKIYPSMYAWFVTLVTFYLVEIFT